ncbi:MAG: cytochrome P450 [Deltaproteobacteria bacterium]|nr:cytochrome P450 [Deltaproteobacteria bacterium]
MAENPNLETREVNLFDPEVAACPQPVYRRMLAGCPVAKSAMGGAPIISRYEDVSWALRHPEIFSSAMDLQIALGTERPMIPQQIDPPAQTKYRKILDPRFSKKRMMKLEPKVRADAGALIDRLIDDGECEFNRAFAIPFPCNAFLHLMGLPSEELEHFLRMKDGIIRPQTQTDDPEKVQEVRIETGKNIYAYFEDLIAERRKDPRDDLITYFTTAEIEGEKLTHNEILDICFLFLLGGLDTVTATLGCNIAYLAENPEQRRRLVENEALLDGAVEELLRWETPVTGVPRVLKQDITVGGIELKEGELVSLSLGASNIDEGEFVDPEDVDFERERNRHLAFGGGAHRCLGSHLARMELRVALEEWHKRIPDYSVKPGETPLYSAGIREVQYLPLVWPAS